MSQREHEQSAASGCPARCALLTVSDTRTLKTDTSGSRIVANLLEAGHEVARRDLVPDEPKRVAACLRAWIDDDEVDVVITTGGTGFSRRDGTVDVVARLLTTEMPGFGELFRSISYAEIGPAAMLSRAVAGLVTSDDGADTYIFALPGSVNAVETAMTKLIAPQLAHLVWERRPK